MVGLAGAGKSTFSRRLESSGDWVRVNQDDLKRKGCEELVSKTVPLVRQGKVHIVIDRCNITRAQRREILDLLGSPPAREVVCVFFDFPREVCKAQAAAREDHPTIKKGGGARIIDDQAKCLQRPAAAEGFSAVDVVKSFEEAEAILQRYGVATSAAAKSQATYEAEPALEEGLGPKEITIETDQPCEAGNTGTLPASFLSWLKEALTHELPSADAEGVLDAVAVILEAAGVDDEALASAVEVLNSSGAPQCAAALPGQWSSTASS
jgi:predicted kinase